MQNLKFLFEILIEILMLKDRIWKNYLILSAPRHEFLPSLCSSCITELKITTCPSASAFTPEPKIANPGVWANVTDNFLPTTTLASMSDSRERI